jgi:hypothetical protein
MQRVVFCPGSRVAVRLRLICSILEEIEMNMPNQGQVYAAGRHVLTFAMGGVAFAAALHIVSEGDIATISKSISQISDGVAQIAAGLAPLIALASALYASWSASHKSQVAAVTAGVADGTIKNVVILTPTAPSTPPMEIKP